LERSAQDVGRQGSACLCANFENDGPPALYKSEMDKVTVTA
jgi:hypothetical protein